MVKGSSRRIAFKLVAVTALVASCTTTRQTPEPPGLGPMVDRLETDEPQSIYGMAASSTAESTKVAAEILEAGGNAIDAAVAAAFAVGVSDPGDGGLGGATYILIRLANGYSTVIDGSAVTPLRVDRARIAEMLEAKETGGIELAAVPAIVAALDYAASKYGTMPLADLIEPSMTLAKRGYRATPFQEVSIRTYFEDVKKSDYLKHFVLENGEEPPSVATRQCRPVLANTLRRIAVGGALEFYRGSIANEIEADMVERGGFVSRDDLGVLRIREVEPLRGSYRGTEILAIPHPSIGGAVIEALNILEQYPIELLVTDTVNRYQVFAEAFRIATADHERVLGDRSFEARQRRERLLTKEHAAKRAALIEFGRALVNEEFPSGREAVDAGGDKKRAAVGNTTQVSVVDRWGNAVSLTQSLGRFFGSKVATPSLGFPYNSLLESVAEHAARSPIPTTMCPSMVIEDGEVLLVLGSGSSNRIPGIVTTVISNVVDRNLGLRDAVLAPRILLEPYRNSNIKAEVIPPITGEQIDELASFGYQRIQRTEPPVKLSHFAHFGSVNAVHFNRQSRVLTGVGDPRRNGEALGARF